MIILREAIENETSILEYENIKDNLDFIIQKTQETVNLYKKLSIHLEETEECMQANILLQNIKSLLVILKYSLKARHTKVSIDDIFNCINIISQESSIILKYSYNIILEYENIDNILPIFPILE